MNPLVMCPGCGFRGRLPEGLSQLKTIVCPQCRTEVALQQLQPTATPVDDASYPIWVDDQPHRPAPPPDPALPPHEPYTGEFMKEEAERFSQYVTARLTELHRRRLEMAEAENRFELMTMERKQDLVRHREAILAEREALRDREQALQAKEEMLAAREAALAAREAELAAREARVARSEARAADIDRRMAELRATIDTLDARRAALAEERAELDRRAEALDKAELAMHRRTAELDELDERLRMEQEEFELLKEQFFASQTQSE